jgi:hypothetical protein
MNTLIVIPHAYIANAPGKRIYGSERNSAAARAAALLRCVAALQQNFGPGQHLVSQGEDPRANMLTESRLQIVICTSGDQHLIDTLPAHLAHHHSTALDPRMLGFVCQAILRDNVGRFDWFGYLEDDCEITDPLFFSKLAWFNAQFGDNAFLQPNRYELSTGQLVQKLYIDGRLPVPNPWLDSPGAMALQASAFGQDWRFRRVSNPHSGCFFADAAQMARLAADAAFAAYSEAFVGPLESAATLPLLRNFAVYKPARENAGFLEMRHVDQRLLDQRLFFTINARGEVIRRISEDWEMAPDEPP